MKKILTGFFVFTLLTISIPAHASVLGDLLNQIKSLKHDISVLKSQQGASVYNSFTPILDMSKTISFDDTSRITRTTDLTPRISYWWGKVNQHINVSKGVWQTDPDGRSGANLNKLQYCKKWYSNTTSVKEYKFETIKDWHDAGNVKDYVGTKMSYECVNDVLTTTPSIKVLSPNGGETYFIGNTHNSGDWLKYKATLSNYNKGSSYHIYLTTRNNSSWKSGFYVPIGGTTELNPDNMTNPINIAGSMQLNNRVKPGIYYLLAEYTNAKGSHILDFSDYYFKIGSATTTTPSIKVLSPNGGETYNVGDTINIKWSENNFPDDGLVTIALQDNYGYNEYLIDNYCTSNNPCVSIHNGYFNTIIPNTVRPGLYKIRIFCSIRNSERGCYIMNNQDLSDNYFKISSANTSTTPIISGVSGPQQLKIYEKGTWKISASDPSGGNLSYSVDWGDNYKISNQSKSSSNLTKTNQSATFTHSYYKEGNYNPIFTVTNSSRKKAETSLSLSVGNSTTTPSIKVLSPNGGETYFIGNTHNSGDWLKYKATLSNYNKGSSYHIYLTTRNNSSWKSGFYVPIGGTTELNPDNMTNPINIAGSMQLNNRVKPGIYYLLAEYTNAKGSHILDFSDYYFKIGSATTTTPSIKVLSPNGGETYIDQQQIAIKWTGISNFPKDSLFNISLVGYNSNGNMLMYTPIFSRIHKDGTLVANLPKIPTHSEVNFGKYFKVEITDNGKGNSDISDGLFTITPAPSNTPTVTVLSPNDYSSSSFTTSINQSCSNIIGSSKLLSYWSKGKDVESLQLILEDEGYINKNDIDGIFGPGTRNAVKSFQKTHLLQPDGVVGAHTISTLNNKWKSKCSSIN